MRRKRTTFGLLAATVLAVTALGASACSSSDSSSAGTTESTSAGMTAPTSEGQKNIVETAAAAGEFTTLASLLTKAGLVETLQTEGPFTVFAPTDAAFAQVPKKTLNALAKDPEQLKAVLLYHVVDGKVPAAQAMQLDSAKTLEGSSVAIKTADGKVYLDGAEVTTPDVMASNGVIHVINGVLIP